ncbi:hypothetical protein C8J57DRAFT_1708804 [Mycena rebaudengoi]|nr:hypothetical protein C8J57DRAFT_1708804 [Mycena rebaudengoi]
MDLQKAENMLFTHWVDQITPITGAVIGFSVQAFFCRRLWIISNNIYVVAFVVLLFVFGLVAAITAFEFSGQLFLASQTVIEVSGQLTAVNSFETTHKAVWSSIYYATVVTGDVILSGSTIYFLLKRSHQALPETVGILNRFVRLGFQSAVPVTLCALANCICAASHSYNPVTNSRTVRSESSEEMMDIPEHMFEPRIVPSPDDINRPKAQQMTCNEIELDYGHDTLI